MTSNDDEFDPFAGGELSHVARVTAEQEEIWLSIQLGGTAANLAYNQPIAFELRGDLDVDALERAVSRLAERHEALRTTFSPDGASMCIAASVTVPFTRESLDGGADRARSVEASVRRVVGVPFDLVSGPLLRAHYLRVAEHEHVLVLVSHHLVCDGWSLGVIARDLAHLYGVERARGGAVLPPALAFSDYAAARVASGGGPAEAASRAYWRAEFRELPPPLDLPLDRPRPAERTFAADRLDFALPAALVRELRSVATAHGASIAAILLAAFQGLVFRLTGQRTFATALPVAGQSIHAQRELVGHCVHALPIRADVDPARPFAEHLVRVRSSLLEAIDHAEVSFGAVVKDVAVPRDPSRVPLAPVMFNVDQDSATPELAGLELSIASPPRAHENFELFVNARLGPGDAILETMFKTDLFDRSTIERWLASYRTLLESIVARPSTAIGDLELLPADERRRVLVDLNRTRVDVPVETVSGLFRRMARRRPERAAVISGGRALTYGELDRASGALAEELRRAGIGAGHFVGVSLPRSVELLVGLLGILRSGAAYVPLDPEYPRERLDFIARDAGLKAVVTDRALAAQAPSDPACPRILVDDLPARPEASDLDASSPERAAYVIYTSGSTGVPKGVVVEHRNVTNLLASMAREPGLDADDVLVAVTTPSFDISVLELFLPLSVGARVVIATREQVTQGELLADLLATSGATAMQATPSGWRLLLEAGWKGSPGLKALTGGEALAADLAASLLPRTKSLWNCYGPTETTVWSTVERVAPGTITIGRPIANTFVYVLDARMRPVPTGVSGDLYIGGLGVTRGYWQRPELDRERFVPDPFAGEAARMYKTGDLARLRPDGRLEWLGRSDFQVKVRGHRIELPEIEARLAAVEGVLEAVAVVRVDRPNDQRIVAYVRVAAGVELREEALKERLRADLPGYMVPQHIVRLDAFPQTANAKIDRKALPPPEVDAAPHQLPGTEVERLVAQEMGELLGVSQVGLEGDFFALGGHSLLAQRLTVRARARWGIDLPMRVVFTRPTVKALSDFIEAALRAKTEVREAPPAARTFGPIDARPLDEPLPLSHAQQRLWFLDQLHPGTSFLNLPGCLRIRGPLDVAALGWAVAELGRRHDALRTAVVSDGGEPRQVVRDVTLGLEVHDLDHLRGASDAARSAALEQACDEAARRPMDPARAPLVRFDLFRVAPEDHALLFVASHLIFDGTSRDLVFRDLRLLYEARLLGRPVPDAPRLRFRDFARWHRAWLDGEAPASEAAFWTRYLAGMPAILELPTDRPRSPVTSYAGRHESVRLAPELVRRLRRVAQGHRASFSMLALAAAEIVLARYTGQADFGVGLPVHGRMRPECEDVVGMFVNTLVMRSAVRGGGTFADLLGRVRDESLEALQHDNLAFDQVVQLVRPARERGRTPLFQAMFSHQRVLSHASGATGLALEDVPVFASSAATDVTFWVFEYDDDVSAAIETAAELFGAETTARLCRSFERVLAAVAENPDLAVDRIPVLADEDERHLLYTLNDTRAPWDETALVHRLFERAADARPTASAVLFEDQRLDFATLDARANQLAHLLRARGVGRDGRVGVFLRRGPELAVAILAAMKAGGAYVPLDPMIPAERVEYVLSHSGAQVLVTTTELEARLASHPAVVLLDGDAELLRAQPATRLALPEASDQLAYVIYTSGSTGRPKGVMVEHRNAVSFFTAMERAIALDDAGVSLSATTVTFDVSVLEILGSLTHGRTIVLLGETTLGEIDDERYRIPGLVARHAVTHFHCTPTQCRILLLDGEGRRALAALKQLVLAGEALTQDLADELAGLGAVDVVNAYGPTETTVYSTFARVRRGERVTIGKPIANTIALVLDAAGRPVPFGATGELCIGGPGVTRGYLGQPELTRERFVPNALRPDVGGRLYRTGDLVRYASDGALVYLGRNDHQVKIRGFRIELGEIEVHLSAIRGVKGAVVVAHGEGADKRLVAYLAIGAAFAGDASVRTTLRALVPEYMVPSAFVHLDALPLTPSGKVDRKALPEPTSISAEVASHVAPDDEIERILCRTWAEVLHMPDVSVTSDFFALGGHSLLAVQIFNAIERKFDVRLPMGTLFERPTVRGLAEVVREAKHRSTAKGSSAWTTAVPIQPRGEHAPFFCVAGIGGNPMNLIHLARELGEEQPFYGLQHRGVDGALAPHRTIRAMAEEFVHDIRAVQRHGPYFIGGFSAGGLAAYEAARIFLAEGEKVALVVLLDTSNPLTMRWSLRERLAAHLRNLRRVGPSYLTTRAVATVKRRIGDARRAHHARIGARNNFEYRVDEVTQAMVDAEMAYEPQPLDADVVLVQADSVIPAYAGVGYPMHESNGWRGLVRGRLEIAGVKSQHLDLVTEQIAPRTAAAILGALVPVFARAAPRHAPGATAASPAPHPPHPPSASKVPASQRASSEPPMPASKRTSSEPPPP